MRYTDNVVDVHLVLEMRSLCPLVTCALVLPPCSFCEVPWILSVGSGAATFLHPRACLESV